MNPAPLSLIVSPPPSGGDDEFSRHLQRLLSKISTWVKVQKGMLSEAYLVPEPDGLRLYAVGRQETYDFSLSRELSEFSVRLCTQGMDVNVTLLPAGSSEEIAAFIGPERGPAIRIPAE